MQYYNKPTIRAFVNDEINAVLEHTSSSMLASEITKQIVHEAKGIFVWAWLVTREIVVAIQSGSTEPESLALVTGFPTGLTELYGRLIRKGHHAEEQEAAALLYLVRTGTSRQMNSWAVLCAMRYLRQKGTLPSWPEGAIAFRQFLLRARARVGTMVEFFPAVDLHSQPFRFHGTRRGKEEMYLGGGRLFQKSLDEYLDATRWDKGILHLSAFHLDLTRRSGLWFQLSIDCLLSSKLDQAVCEQICKIPLEKDIASMAEVYQSNLEHGDPMEVVQALMCFNVDDDVLPLLPHALAVVTYAVEMPEADEDFNMGKAWLKIVMGRSVMSLVPASDHLNTDDDGDHAVWYSFVGFYSAFVFERGIFDGPADERASQMALAMGFDDCSLHWMALRPSFKFCAKALELISLRLKLDGKLNSDQALFQRLLQRLSSHGKQADLIAFLSQSEVQHLMWDPILMLTVLGTIALRYFSSSSNEAPSPELYHNIEVNAVPLSPYTLMQPLIEMPYLHFSSMSELAQARTALTDDWSGASTRKNLLPDLLLTYGLNINQPCSEFRPPLHTVIRIADSVLLGSEDDEETDEAEAWVHAEEEAEEKPEEEPEEEISGPSWAVARENVQEAHKSEYWLENGERTSEDIFLLPAVQLRRLLHLGADPNISFIDQTAAEFAWKVAREVLLPEIQLGDYHPSKIDQIPYPFLREILSILAGETTSDGVTQPNQQTWCLSQKLIADTNSYLVPRTRSQSRSRSVHSHHHQEHDRSQCTTCQRHAIPDDLD